MSYTADSNLDNPIHQRERELLMAGFSYAEVAQVLSVKQKSVSERNRLVYKINIWDAFSRRIAISGIPNRLSVSDSFGYWFSGFFDGEGCLAVFNRARKDRYVERRISIQIGVRDDDADTIQFIKDNIGVGLVYFHTAHGIDNPNSSYRLERIKDLAEIIIPLFEKYPLHTKKSIEFPIWKSLVVGQYISTLGGYSQRASGSEEYNATFDAGRQAIREIRTFTR